MRQNALLVASAAAAALLSATPAQAESVCVTETAPVYSGCTIVYFEEGHHCITGGGTVLSTPYRLNPCR